jgi:hypothetical protein
MIFPTIWWRLKATTREKKSLVSCEIIQGRRKR